MTPCKRATAILWYSGFNSNPINFLLFARATIAAVPEPRKGSRMTSPTLLDPFTTRSINAIGNWAGCDVLSFELLFVPEVTLGICQTSDGFFPSGLHFNFPFFFWSGYFKKWNPGYRIWETFTLELEIKNLKMTQSNQSKPPINSKRKRKSR